MEVEKHFYSIRVLVRLIICFFSISFRSECWTRADPRVLPNQPDGWRRSRATRWGRPTRRWIRWRRERRKFWPSFGPRTTVDGKRPRRTRRRWWPTGRGGRRNRSRNTSGRDWACLRRSPSRSTNPSFCLFVLSVCFVVRLTFFISSLMNCLEERFNRQNDVWGRNSRWELTSCELWSFRIRF